MAAPISAPLKKTLTQEALHELMEYDPEDQQVKWKVDEGGIRNGRIVGGVTAERVNVEYESYSIGTLLWLFHFGSYPNYTVRFIDGDRMNHSPENLEDITPKELRYKRRSSVNMSGKKGVAKVMLPEGRESKKYPDGCFYWARMQRNGKPVSLGCYATIEEAEAAYERALNQLLVELENERESA